MIRAQKKRAISIKDSDIQTLLFRNFRGAPDRFNRDGGKRSFTVVLTEDKARELEDEGFNIKWKEFDDGAVEPRLKVMVRFDNVPPKIMIGTDPQRMVTLSEEDVGQLDNAELETVDLIVNPYRFEDRCTAYLQTGYFVIAPDAFSDKYSEFVEAEDDLPFDA